jgi:hypothetical protein
LRTAIGRDAIAALLQGIIGQGWTGIRIAVTDVRRLGEVILVANEYTALGSGVKAGEQRGAHSSHVPVHADGEWRSAMHTAT